MAELDSVTLLSLNNLLNQGMPMVELIPATLSPKDFS